MIEINEKLKIAVELLKEGQPNVVGGLRLSIEDNYLHVIGWSEFKYFENLTKQKSLMELEQIKNLFNEMVEASSDLRNLVKDLNIKYSLYYNDSGKASIAICSEKDGIIDWQKKF